jgi:hypothetical protein
VGSAGSEDQLANYLGTVDRAIQLAAPDVLQYVVFSDSVVVNSTEDGSEHFEAIVAACSTLFRELLQSRIAVRGAIAHGPFLRSTHPNGAFVAGRPIVEAFDYEKRQDWVGIMLAPSVVARQRDLGMMLELPRWDEVVRGWDVSRVRLPSLIYRNSSIPFHKDPGASLEDPDSYSGYAVLPTGEGVTPTSFGERLNAAIEWLVRLKMVAPDPKAQRKFRNTTNWLRDVQGEWRSVVDAARRLEGD